MPIHKLAEGPITLTVVSVAKVEGNFGPQVRLSGDTGIDVYLNETSAERQLGRLSLDLDSVIGKTIYLEQVKKNGTTFTNISLSSGGASIGAPAASSYAAAAPAQKMDLDAIAELYGRCVSHAMAQFGARMEEMGVPMDASALQAAAATIFIKATR